MTPSDDGEDVDPRKALVTAQRALAKANGIKADLDEATTRTEQLREDVASIERRLSEVDDVDGSREVNDD